MDMDSEVFIKKGLYCIVSRDTHEIQEKFIQRGYLVVGNKPITKEEQTKSELLSRICMNMKYDNCTYDSDIQKTCHLMTQDEQIEEKK